MADFIEPDLTEAREIATSHVDRVVAGLPRCKFSTKRFVEVLLEDEEAAAAYLAALETLGSNPRVAKMALHGQVISVALRSNPLLKFGGFVRNDPQHEDPFSHSSWWRKEQA